MASIQLRLEDPGAPDFAPRVVDILNSTIPPDASTTPDEAAAAFNSLLQENYVETDGASDFLWWFWDLMHDLSRQIPYNSTEAERLANTLQALQNLPVRTVRLGDSWGVGSTVEIWTDLPMFCSTYGEALDNDPRAPNEVEAKRRYVNLQAYAARVAGLGLINANAWSAWALWSIVDALEGTMTPIRGAPDEINEDPAAVEDIAYKVKSAAAWVVLAGNYLYGRDEVVDGATAGPLWRLEKKEAIKLRKKTRGTDGFCPERWNLWKDRFGVIRDCDKLERDVRNEAQYAYTAMEVVEKLHS
ncbi:hypothetical protein QQS21_007663 [Conoideocrella luteorostrata]|uniref:Uncharacterized protein n=1 Tax=Conoideocrella luteorostrata TaxID=1105319 RepID=A0AAJ0FRV7_9HYPO|nr:hypothetical protein QQS21_007663 [Conoideocrella luteorostrata]